MFYYYYYLQVSMATPQPERIGTRDVHQVGIVRTEY